MSCRKVWTHVFRLRARNIYLRYSLFIGNRQRLPVFMRFTDSFFHSGPVMTCVGTFTAFLNTVIGENLNFSYIVCNLLY